MITPEQQQQIDTLLKQSNYQPPANTADWFSQTAPKQTIPPEQPKSYLQKPVPGSETAVIPAKPATGQSGLADAAKMIPNALGDIWNLVKSGTVGTIKNLAQIPGETLGAAKDIITHPETAGEMAKGAVGGGLESLWGLIPQSAKELSNNVEALKEIPKQFHDLAKKKGGYANAFIDMVKNAPGAIPQGIADFANQVDRGRQAFENHPINELLGYYGMKTMIEHPITSTKEGFKTTGEFLKSPIKSTVSAFREIPVDQFIQKIKDIIPEKSVIRGKMTNTDPNIFKRIENPIYAEKVKNYLSALDENRNPNADLAYQFSENVKRLEQESGALFGERAEYFTEQGLKIDVGTRIKEVETAIKKFAPGNDIKFEQMRNKDGSFSGYKLTKGQYSPFTSTEVGYINSMIKDISGARAITADEVLALDKKLSQYYNLVDDTNGARPYHALVMKIKGTTESMIANSLPEDLRDSYKDYARIQNMKSEFDNKIVDAKGNPKDSAASFLGNLTGKNKEIIQNKVRSYQDVLGMDLMQEVQAISDAMKLHLTEAPTGGRISDILKVAIGGGTGAVIGSIIPGVGTGVGGIAGYLAIKRLTSPRLGAEKVLKESLKEVK